MVNADFFSSKISSLKRWYKNIYDLKGKTVELFNDELVVKTFDYLNKNLKKNFIQKYSNDKEVLFALQKNVNIFSLFKNHNEQKEIASLLTKNGKIIAYKEFEKAALKISVNYNRNWLKAEFNTVTEQAKLTAYWNKIDRQKKRYPYLQYITRDDNKVRQEHQEFNGLVLPVSHSFWNTNFPVNGFNCRCTVRQLTKKQAEKIGITKKKNIETYSSKFNFNAGKEQKIFGENHNYFKDIPTETQKLLNEYAEVSAKEKKRW